MLTGKTGKRIKWVEEFLSQSEYGSSYMKMIPFEINFINIKLYKLGRI